MPDPQPELTRLRAREKVLVAEIRGLQTEADSAEKTTNSAKGTLEQLVIAVRARCAKALATISDDRE